MTHDELVDVYRSPDSIPPVAALAGVDDIDWSAVKHAYGEATDMPALLRALASPEPTHRDYAAQGLFGTVWHQGTVYEATATALPFLFALLESDATQGSGEPRMKAIVVALLSAIAEGRPPLHRCETDETEAARWRSILEKSGRSLDDEMEAGRRYGAAIRQAIQQKLDLLYPFLRDSDPGVRRAVLITIGEFPDVAARVLSDLGTFATEETDPAVRKTAEAVIDAVQRRRRAADR